MLALLALLLAQAPGGMLEKVDRQEDLNDLLEVQFDGICGQIKSAQTIDSSLGCGGRWPDLICPQMPSN